MGELNDILQRLEPSLGSVDRQPAPLEGGITNRNYRVHARGRGVRPAPAREGHRAAGDRPGRRALANEPRRAGLGLAPAVAASFEGCLVTRYLAARRRAARWRATGAEIAAALRAFHDLDLALPVRFWVPDLLADYAAVVRERGAQLPDGTRGALAVRPGSRAVWRSAVRGPATTTCWPAT